MAEYRFKAIVRGLIRDGIYPSPAAIRRRQGRDNQRNNLNGRECVWREEVFREVGWRRGKDGNRSWKGPYGK